MGNMLVRLVSQLQELFTDMPASRRTAVLIFLGLVISSLVALMMWAQKPDFQVLYSGISESDAASVVNRLRERRVPFQYERERGVILVPAGAVHESRLALAQEGLPTGGGVGFEIFDRSSLGVTDFVQRVNFLRALQGELARTITQLRAVEAARVHIVMPDRTLFTEERRQPSVSVALSLTGGATLSKGQVNGIVHLVASAVEGLESKNVTVVDQRGNVLAGGRSDEDEQFLTASQLEFETSLERRLENRVETMLAKVVGAGRAVARVDVDLNLRRVERTRELFDPEKQVVRSERRVKEKSESGQAPAGGVPGVEANVPASEQAGAAQTQAGGTNQSSSRTSETVNFEIDKTVERIVEPTGDIRRISAAVMVDGTYAAAANGGAPQFQARSKEELDNFAALVSAAIGIDTKRGDTVKIVSVPIQAPVADGAGAAESAQRAFILTVVKYVLGVIALALIFIFVVRPLISWISTLEIAAPRREGLPVGPDGLPLPEGVVPGALPAAPAAPAEKTPAQLEAEEARRIYEEVYGFVEDNPEKAADVLRGWAKERV